MRLALLLFVLLAGCATERRDQIESREILDRHEVSTSVEVKHILIGWSWLEDFYRRAGAPLDPRAEGRTETEADQLAAQLLGRCREGAPFDTLMRENSEDAGSKDGVALSVDAKAPFVEPFKDLALRLQPGECGLVKSKFGWHVMKRVR